VAFRFVSGAAAACSAVQRRRSIKTVSGRRAAYNSVGGVRESSAARGRFRAKRQQNARHTACHTRQTGNGRKGVSMPRRIRDYGVAILALATLLLVLTRIDDRVPGHLAQIATDAWHGRWNQPGSELSDFLFHAAGSSAMDNVFLAALVVVAGLLLVLMLRT
jgi:hypothetical protein